MTDEQQQQQSEPNPYTEVKYVVEYRDKDYIGAPDEKTWYVADMDGDTSLARAMELADLLKQGYRLRGAGFVTASKTRIIQQVWVGTVILTDEDEEEI